MPNDVYNVLKADLGPSDGYDLCQLRWENEGNEQMLIAEVNEAGKEDRSTKQREHLSAIIDRW